MNFKCDNFFFQQIGKSQTVDELAENVNDEEIQTILNDLGANTVHLGMDKKNWYKKIILRHIPIDCKVSTGRV